MKCICEKKKSGVCDAQASECMHAVAHEAVSQRTGGTCLLIGPVQCVSPDGSGSMGGPWPERGCLPRGGVGGDGSLEVLGGSAGVGIRWDFLKMMLTRNTNLVYFAVVATASVGLLGFVGDSQRAGSQDSHLCYSDMQLPGRAGICDDPGRDRRGGGDQPGQCAAGDDSAVARGCGDKSVRRIGRILDREATASECGHTGGDSRGWHLSTHDRRFAGGSPDSSQDRSTSRKGAAKDEALRHLIFGVSFQACPHRAAWVNHRLSLAPRLVNAGHFFCKPSHFLLNAIGEYVDDTSG